MGEKRSASGLGVLLAHDVYCLVNRARGTALVSPEDVASALRRAAQRGQLRLRHFGETLAVALSKSSDADADGLLLEAIIRSPAGLSAPSLAAELGLTTSEAQHLLRDAEDRAVVVRD